jgi:hypothetical protein
MKLKNLTPWRLFGAGIVFAFTSTPALQTGETLKIWGDDFHRDYTFQCVGDNCPPGGFAEVPGGGLWCRPENKGGYHEDGVTHFWMVHCSEDGNPRSCDHAAPGLRGEAWVNFPGPTGDYKVTCGTFLWPWSGPPYWVKLNDDIIVEERTPLKEPRCTDIGGDCIQIDITERLHINEGDRITWGGETMLNDCDNLDQGWGAYAAFYNMCFTLLEPAVSSITLSARSLSFETVAGQMPPVQTITVSGGSGGTLTGLAATENADWLEVAVEGTTMKNSVALAGKDPGTYSTTVKVSAQGAESDSYMVSLEIFDLRAPENPANAVAGLDYKYYEGTGWTSLPDFAMLQPAGQGILTGFSIADATAQDNFAFVFSGYFAAPSAGLYTFFLQSDNGSRLYIGDKLVVENNEPSWKFDSNAMQPLEQQGKIGLGQGKHALRVQYHDIDGPQSLAVRYQGPSIPKKAIPSSELFIQLSNASPVHFGASRPSAHVSGCRLQSNGQGTMVVRAPLRGPHKVELFGTNGICMARIHSDGGATITIPAGSLALSRELVIP